MKKKKTVLEDVLSTLTKYFAVLCIAVTVIIALSGLRIVKSGEVALVLRFGRLTGNTREEQIHEPGLLFAFPYIIDEVITVPTGSIMKLDVTTHYTSTQMSTYTRNGYVMTGDRNIVLVSASVQYVISDPVEYVLGTADPQSLIRAHVSSAMLDAAASVSSDTLLTTGKNDFASAVQNDAQSRLSADHAGVRINSVELTTVSMPFEVKDIYNEVNSANVKAGTALEKAAQYRESLIPSAQAKANALINEANAAYSTEVAAANAALSEFYGTEPEFRLSPETVKTRLYNEKISAIIAKIGTVRVVSDSDTRIIITGGS